MKTRILTGVAAAALLATISTMTYAQNTSGDQERGSTGWGGGAKDQPSQEQGAQGSPLDGSGKKIQVHDEIKAKDQPTMATGGDLKGQPQQFAPSKTPE